MGTREKPISPNPEHSRSSSGPSSEGSSKASRRRQARSISRHTAWRDSVLGCASSLSWRKNALRRVLRVRVAYSERRVPCARPSRRSALGARLGACTIRTPARSPSPCTSITVSATMRFPFCSATAASSWATARRGVAVSRRGRPRRQSWSGCIASWTMETSTPVMQTPTAVLCSRRPSCKRSKE